MIQKYQREEPSITANYKDGTYHKGYFRVGSNIDIKIKTCKDKIDIPSKIQSYVVHWYHAYLLHPGMDITEAMICEHLYWPNIKYSARKEVNDCNTCQRTKQSNKKYGKLPAKLSEAIPRNRLCVHLTGPYVIKRKGQKEHIYIKLLQ